MLESSVEYWDSMYQRPLDELPWEIKDPPQELQDYFAEYPPQGGLALDVGCGSGNFSFFLAGLGFKVTAVDFSQPALDIGRENNKKLHLPVDFVQADATKILPALNSQKFDFILDYKLLHHLPDQQIPEYAAQFSDLLSQTGKLFLVCYSDKDNQDQPYKAGKFGNIMHYRGVEEIRARYSNLNEVSYREVMVGKRLNHAAHCFVFDLKEQ